MSYRELFMCLVVLRVVYHELQIKSFILIWWFKPIYFNFLSRVYSTAACNVFDKQSYLRITHCGNHRPKQILEEFCLFRVSKIATLMRNILFKFIKIDLGSRTSKFSNSIVIKLSQHRISQNLSDTTNYVIVNDLINAQIFLYVSLYELIAIIIIDFNLTSLVAKLYLITFTEVSYEVVFVSSQLIIPN